jgi:hypothetical protein
MGVYKMIRPEDLRSNFQRIEQSATGKVRYIIQFPFSISLKESRVGVTEVQIHCEIPSEGTGRQLRTINNASDFHNYVRNLDDNIPVLYVRTASLVLNYYEFHYVRAFDMVMMPKEKITRETQNPTYFVDIKFYCMYYKKMEKSSGMTMPTIQRFQIDEALEGDISKSCFKMNILDPGEEHD